MRRPLRSALALLLTTAAFAVYTAPPALAQALEEINVTDLAWAELTSKVNIHAGAEWGNDQAELYDTNIFDDRTPTSLNC